MNAKPALVRPLFASDLDAQAALWISRFCSSNSAAIYQLNDGVFSEELRQLIGVTPREGQLSRRTLRPLLKVRAQELESMQPRRKTILQRNVDMLGKLIGLDTLQVEILSFAALSQQHAWLSEIVESIRTTSVDAIAGMLSVALVQRESDVLRALHADGLLLSTGIVSVESGNIGRGLVLLVPAGLTTALFSAADNIKMLMAACVALESAERSRQTSRNDSQSLAKSRSPSQQFPVAPKPTDKCPLAFVRRRSSLLRRSHHANIKNAEFNDARVSFPTWVSCGNTWRTRFA